MVREALETLAFNRGQTADGACDLGGAERKWLARNKPACPVFDVLIVLSVLRTEPSIKTISNGSGPTSYQRLCFIVLPAHPTSVEAM